MWVTICSSVRPFATFLYCGNKIFMRLNCVFVQVPDRMIHFPKGILATTLGKPVACFLQCAGRFSDFAMNERARRTIPPNRVHPPTNRGFTSGCLPHRLSATQFPSHRALRLTPSRTGIISFIFITYCFLYLNIEKAVFSEFLRIHHRLRLYPKRFHNTS